MISDFAKPINYPIPEKLNEFVSYGISGQSEDKWNIEYPMFATGFPILILTESIPRIKINGETILPESKFNIAGQIYDANVSLSFQDQCLDALGLILSPTAPFYLFHTPAKPLLNKWTPIEKISPHNITRLIKNLDKEDNIESKLKLIFNYLEALAKNRKDPIPWLDRSVFKIITNQGVIEINQILENEAISERHFRRKFQEIVGMPPKYYCKVIQITSVFQLLQQDETDNLTQVALNCGYFDQSHFIKDFKKHIGLSPNNFLNSEYSFLSTYLGAS